MITLKDLADKIIIKRKVHADNLDNNLTQEFDYDMKYYFDEYQDAYYQTDSYRAYNFTIDELAEYCNDPYKLNMMTRDNSLIRSYLEPEQIEKLLDKKRTYVFEHYVELNPYYRVYLGLPPLVKDDVFGYIEDPNYIYYEKEPISGIDIRKPVHKYNKVERSLYRVSGKLDELRAKHPTVLYLKWIGRDTDIIQMRNSNEYDVMWYDRSDTNVVRFIGYYRAMRNLFMTNHYSEYDAYKYPLYERMIVMHLMLAAMADYNSDIPKEKLDTSLTDPRDLENLFLSYGVPKFDIATSNLQTVAQKLNTIHMEKGSKKVFDTISKLFDGVTINKYFIIKQLVNEGAGDLDNLSDDDKYELKFVKAPIMADDPYKYMNVSENVIDYHSIVDKDPRWGANGDKLESTLKNWKGFSWSESKYLALNNRIDISTFSIKMHYFYRYVIQNKAIVEKLKIYLDTVDVNTDLFEILAYLQCLIFRKFKIHPDIPDSMESVIYMFTINNNVDYTRLKEVVKDYFRYHPEEERYDIDEFVTMISTQNYSMKNIMDTFEIDYRVVEKLDNIRQNTSDYRDYELLDTVIKAITYGKKVPELYNNETNMESFLSSYTTESSKFILRLNELQNKTDPSQAISNEIAVVLNLLKAQVDSIRNKELFNLFDTAQTLYTDLDIIKYLELIIDFYKSYTQDVIDRGVAYVLNDIHDTIPVLEDLRIKFDLSFWDMFNLSFLFTSETTEFINFVLSDVLLEETIESGEVLSILFGDSPVDQVIIGRYGKNLL